MINNPPPEPAWLQAGEVELQEPLKRNPPPVPAWLQSELELQRNHPPLPTSLQPGDMEIQKSSSSSRVLIIQKSVVAGQRQGSRPSKPRWLPDQHPQDRQRKELPSPICKQLVLRRRPTDLDSATAEARSKSVGSNPASPIRLPANHYPQNYQPPKRVPIMGKSDVSIECFDSVPDAPPRTIEFYLSEGSYDLKALWKICKKLYAGIVVPGLGIKTYTMMGGMSNISPWETGVALLAPVAGFAYLAWSVVDIGRFLYRHWSDMKSVTSGICVYTKWDSMQIESPQMNIHKVVYFGFAVAQAVPPLVLFSLMRTHHNMPISGSIITTAGVFLALDPLIDFFAAPVSLDSENATAEQKKKIRTRMRNFLGGLAATMGSVLGALLFVNYM